MNLRVDLILETEQRSGSIVSPKSIGRIAAIVGPAILVILIALQCVALATLKGKLNTLNALWAEQEPKKKRAEDLSKTVALNEELRNELNGWKKSRLDWNQQMMGVLREVPVTIHLENLKVTQVLEPGADKTPVRNFVMTLQGKALGADAELMVDRLKRRLASARPFAPEMEEPKVVKFGALDERTGAGKDDRMFQIDCIYKSRRFQ